MSLLDESYMHCRRIAKSRAKNFYYSFLLLPREQRDAMCAIYAFMRRADDIADTIDNSIDKRQSELELFRQELRSSLAGNSSENLIFPAFRQTINRYNIPEQYFIDVLDGMKRDLQCFEYSTFEDLYSYCYQAASVVGMTCIHIFGFESESAPLLAEKCGIAFQLTNIMRDCREDASLGRVYFPLDELRQYGLSKQELMNCSLQSPDPRFQRFMEFQWNRANHYYKESASLLPMIRQESQPALWAIIAIYHKLLVSIRKSGYDVLRNRIKLSRLQKLWIVAYATQMRMKGRTPPFPA